MSGSFSSYEDLYEDPEEVYAEEADSAGSKSQSTGGQARSSQGEQGSSSPPLILGLVAVEEPLMVSKDADVSSIDPTPASSKDLLPLTSGKISVPAVVEAGKEGNAGEEIEVEYDDCGKELQAEEMEEGDDIQAGERREMEEDTEVEVEKETETEVETEEEAEEEDKQPQPQPQPQPKRQEQQQEQEARRATKSEIGNLNEEIDLLIREDGELYKFQTEQQQHQQEEDDIQPEEDEDEDEEEEDEEAEKHGPMWAFNRFLDGVEASVYRADDVERKIERVVSRHVLDPVEGVIDAVGGGVEEGSGMRKVATAIEKTLEPVEDAIDGIERWVGGFVNTRVSPMLSWAAAWGDRRVEQIESYLDGPPSKKLDGSTSRSIESRSSMLLRQQHVHEQ